MKPYIVLEWNDTESDAIGWLVIYNLIKGFSGGGTRMHPSVTRDMVIEMAEVMAYKRNAAENHLKGGMKAGIKYDYKAPDAAAVFKRFIMAIRPYIEVGLNLGSDLGTTEEGMREIFDELGIEEPQTLSMKKDPAIAEGMDNLHKMLKATYNGRLVNDTVTGYGVACAADEAWSHIDRDNPASVIIQGFGCVGLSCAEKLTELGHKIVGIADCNCFVYCKDGLDVEKLIADVLPQGEMDQSKFNPTWSVMDNNAWVDQECDVFIPAAIADVINAETAPKIKARLVCEAANIPTSKEGDAILKSRGIHVVPDFTANLGAIRFFYVMTFGIVEPTPEAILQDTMDLCRKNAKMLFEESVKTGRYERDLAMEIFKPTVQDPPEM